MSHNIDSRNRGGSGNEDILAPKHDGHIPFHDSMNTKAWRILLGPSFLARHSGLQEGGGWVVLSGWVRGVTSCLYVGEWVSKLAGWLGDWLTG